jgi:hypothetical protein
VYPELREDALDVEHGLVDVEAYGVGPPLPAV